MLEASEAFRSNRVDIVVQSGITHIWEISRVDSLISCRLTDLTRLLIPLFHPDLEYLQGQSLLNLFGQSVPNEIELQAELVYFVCTFENVI